MALPYDQGVLLSPATFDWLKILISTLAGLFAGLVADPIKGGLQRRIEVVRLRRSIGFDCLRLLTVIETCKAGLAPDVGLWGYPSLPAFEHYWQSKRELFYADFDLQTLQLNCQMILLLRQSVLDGRRTSADAMVDLENTVRGMLVSSVERHATRDFLDRFLVRFTR